MQTPASRPLGSCAHKICNAIQGGGVIGGDTTVLIMLQLIWHDITMEGRGAACVLSARKLLRN